MRTLYTFAIAVLLTASSFAGELAIVAHRGASRDAPENTIPAFKLAWEQGAEAIEGDFYLTKDGQIVCIHDNRTQRVAGRNLVVGQASFCELRRLDVGAYRGEQFKGTVIPTIAEVFATIPEHKKIYIEIKCGVEIIPALLAAIDKSNLKSEQIVVICFRKQVIRELKAKAPRYKAFWLCSLSKDKAGQTTPSLEAVLATLKQINAEGFSSNKNDIDEVFIKSVKDAGYEYHVWTVDDPKVARRFAKWGAQSITTNAPGYIRRLLVEQNVPTGVGAPSP